MSHTSEPWKIDDRPFEGIPAWIIETETELIAVVPKWTSKESYARLIVTAVNSHYDLLAALKEAFSHCGECGGTGIAYTMEDETQIGQAPGSSAIDCPECIVWREAIAKAEPPGVGNSGGRVKGTD